MSEPFGYAPSWCAEFPNDNPSLHEGVSWICLSVGGPLRPVTRARAIQPVGGVRDTLRRTSEGPAPAVETLPPADALLATDAAADADVPPSVEAPGLVEAVVGSEPLELDAIDDPATEEPALLELEGIDAPAMEACEEPLELDAPAMEACEEPVEPDAPAIEACEEPLELDAIARPGPDVMMDAVFDFDSDASDAVVAPLPEPEHDDGASTSAFAAYVTALVDVAHAAGHSRAAAVLPRLVDGKGLEGIDVPEDVERRLVAADVLVRRGGVVSASDSFAAVATAWRSVLSGATNDLVVCGDSTLDGWSADLLRAFGVGQGGTTDVRRELRRRGVAAFGMLLAA